jgi:methionine biosynthesis protein MetW
MIDDPETHDNRSYDYARHPVESRSEHPVIVDWVPAGSRVIDLGCGNGSLLALLKERKEVTELGVDLSASGVEQCRRKGLNARRGRIDRPLADVGDDAFDVAISNVTLMMVMYPEVLLAEMRRIAPTQIVSFCNFAFLPNRLDHLFSGRMPRPMLSGYPWYSTGHIHQLSLLDFYDLCAEVGLAVEAKVWTLNRNPLVRLLCRLRPNLFSALPILKLRRG